MTFPIKKVWSEWDVKNIRRDFPALNLKVYGKPLVYLDNAATTQKPVSVIESISSFYTSFCANVHRGVYSLSEKATASFEEARKKVQTFINAKESREIIFVRGATEGINLVANTFGRQNVKEGDEILVSAMEHHSNIVPWQMLTQSVGANLRVAPINERGELDMEALEKYLTLKTKLVAITHVSNALGSINPVLGIVKKAHEKNIPILIDGAQAVPHMKIDVQALDCDFYVFSGHKLYGPTGIGVLYGKSQLLEAMPPYQGGGDMIRSVAFEKTTYNHIPYKFEAGTPDIAGVIGLGAALDYLNQFDFSAITNYENSLKEYATEQLSPIAGLKMIGTAREKSALISFIMEEIHPHDVATILDREGIAVRGGHHCAQPLMDFFHLPATVRASFAFYNTRDEIDQLVSGIKKIVEIFK